MFRLKKRTPKQFFYYVPLSDEEEGTSNNNSESCEKCNRNVQCDKTCDNGLSQDQNLPSCSKQKQCCHNHSKLENEKQTQTSDHSGTTSTAVEVNGEKSDPENTTDQKRSRRNCKRKRISEEACPVCGLSVRYADLESHFAKEVDDLSNIAGKLKKHQMPRYVERKGFSRGKNLAYYEAKGNRENRIAAQKAKFVKINSVFCPVCRINLVGTEREINQHVFRCFGEDDYGLINVIDITEDTDSDDTDDNFEEYEIGDETRVRAVSLVPGGHSALHASAAKSRPSDEDTDLNVDVEDTQAFGKPQYTELDVIHDIGRASTSQTENQREVQLRRAVASDSSIEPQVIKGNKWLQNSEIQNEIEKIKSSCSKDEPNEDKEEDTEAENVEKEENSQNTESIMSSSLKERMSDLEQQRGVKCLICLEPYTRPVVSTTCWHVHCEECWLVSMGVKKLCPQCNMIVCPTDLRRIYL